MVRGMMGFLGGLCCGLDWFGLKRMSQRFGPERCGLSGEAVRCGVVWCREKKNGQKPWVRPARAVRGHDHRITFPDLLLPPFVYLRRLGLQYLHLPPPPLRCYLPTCAGDLQRHPAPPSLSPVPWPLLSALPSAAPRLLGRCLAGSFGLRGSGSCSSSTATTTTGDDHLFTLIQWSPAWSTSSWTSSAMSSRGRPSFL